MKTRTSPSCKESINIAVADLDKRLTPRALEELQSRFATALSRFSGRIRDAHLTLTDGRGSQRKADTRSRLAICLENWNVVIAEAQHTRAAVAASRSIEKAQREMGRSVRRRRSLAKSKNHAR